MATPPPFRPMGMPHSMGAVPKMQPMTIPALNLRPTGAAVAAPAAPDLNPILLEIRSGIAAQDKAAVRRSVAAAEAANVPIDAKIRSMLSQWLADDPLVPAAKHVPATVAPPGFLSQAGVPMSAPALAASMSMSKASPGMPKVAPQPNLLPGPGLRPSLAVAPTPAASSTTSPLLMEIRAGIANQDREAVKRAVAAAEHSNVTIEPHVRMMLQQWLGEPVPASSASASTGAGPVSPANSSQPSAPAPRPAPVPAPAPSLAIPAEKAKQLAAAMPFPSQHVQPVAAPPKRSTPVVVSSKPVLRGQEKKANDDVDMDSMFAAFADLVGGTEEPVAEASPEAPEEQPPPPPDDAPPIPDSPSPPRSPSPKRPVGRGRGRGRPPPQTDEPAAPRGRGRGRPPSASNEPPPPSIPSMPSIPGPDDATETAEPAAKKQHLEWESGEPKNEEPAAAGKEAWEYMGKVENAAWGTGNFFSFDKF